MFWLTLLLGCEPKWECVPEAELALDCTPAFQPTYDNLYDEVFEPTCGQGSRSCHSAGGAKGDLVLDEDPDAAYAALLDPEHGRVIPGDASCSLVVIRVEADKKGMPPGDPLSAGERCAIKQWVDAGAAR